MAHNNFQFLFICENLCLYNSRAFKYNKNFGLIEYEMLFWIVRRVFMHAI